MRYKCGGCKKEFNSLRDFPKTLAEPDADNPEKYGYHSICPDCGYEFHEDKWRRQETIHHDGNEIHISTVFLNLNHGHGEKDLWYETLVKGYGTGNYMQRYETKEGAIEGHERVKEAIKGGNYYKNEYDSLRVDIDSCPDCKASLLYSENQEEYICPWCDI